MGRTYTLADLTRSHYLMDGSGRGLWELARWLDESPEADMAVPLLVQADYHGYDGYEPQPRRLSARRVARDSARLQVILSQLEPDQRFGGLTAQEWADWFGGVCAYALAHPASEFTSTFFA